jgi:hypothetical protein
MKTTKLEKTNITPDEYPPKYIGIKGNGKRKCIYRVDGELGLVFHAKNNNETEYRWEHFKIIKPYR